MQQRGFTLIELLVSMAIIGLLAAPMVGAISQTVLRTDENNTRILALVSLENAGRRLAADIRIAQTTNLGPSSSTTTLDLTWTDWADASQYDEYSASSVVYKRYRAIYVLVGADLERTLDVCDAWNTTTATCDGTWTGSTAIAASPVSSVTFTRGTGDLIVMDITSSPKGSGFPTETRTYRARGSILMAPAPA